MRSLLLTAAVCVLFPILAACGPSTPTKGVEEPVPLGQLPDTVTPLHYRLELTIRPDQPRFNGVADIDIDVKEPRRTIFLHGRELKVERVEARLAGGDVVNGTYAQVDKSGVAKLTFERELLKGKATLHLPFDAAFESAPDALTSMADNGEKYAWTQFEETSARRAFPSFDEPRFKTPFDISITSRKSDTAISNTPAIKEEAAGDLKTTTFATTKPLPTYLVALIVGPYDVEEGPALPAIRMRPSEVPLRGITVKGKGERTRFALIETPALLRYLEDYFATPYPYPKLDLITPPNFTAGGMENAGAITYTERGILLDDSASIQQKRYFASLHAHEVAHQWFGDLVTTKWWNDTWLNEAFASWMGDKSASAVWPANELSRETVRSALDVMDTDALSTARAIRQPIKSTDDIVNAFDRLTYDKGAAVLAMFEAYLGEAAFREGVRTHMRRFAYASADAHDFLESLAQGSGKPEVVPAFETFLNQPGVPLVRIKSTCSDRDAIVELSQVPAGASSADDKRRWSIPVCMRDVAKNRYSGCKMLTEQTARVTLKRACGATLMPNAEGAGYYRFSMQQADWSALTAAAPNLTPAEQLAMLHSLRAAFRAGDADAKTFLAALKSVAETGTWDAIAQVRLFLVEMRGNLLTTADRGRFEQTTRDWFAPRLQKITLDARANEPRAITLARAELAEALAKLAADPVTMTALATKGAVYLADIAHGQHRAPLAPELAPAAFWAAIRTGGAPVARDAIDAIKLSTDAEFRNQAIVALSAATDPGANTDIEAFMTSGSLRVREVSTYLRNAFADPDRRAGAWSWLRKDFKKIAAVIPHDARSRLFALAGNLCADQSRAEVEWFFKPMIADTPGAPRIYANTLEAIDRCVSWRKAKGAELAAALR